ncbi:lytic polysaccharide monooxygenase [Streptomyces sp. NPDC094038]|uniref:lytic polysaccharide monooxygenase n=1 Tax=Streptomyces sp. NPDC094038 TaxID=3366055 RepID=UPI00380A1AAE
MATTPNRTQAKAVAVAEEARREATPGGPSELTAAVRHRKDGGTTQYGLHLRWRIGENGPDSSGSDWPPPGDWNGGAAPYPHKYEVWIDGEPVQTAFLYWRSWNWWAANTLWVRLGSEPGAAYRVRIRAEVDGTWSGFTNEVTVRTADAEPWRAPAPGRTGTTAGTTSGAREDAGVEPAHGNASHPKSRAYWTYKENDTSPVCVRAREVNTTDWWEATGPSAEQYQESYPWNNDGGYLEFVKFFAPGKVASCSNPAYAGFDLDPGDGHGDWPVTELPREAEEYTFDYHYAAHHQGESWTHEWFITREGWTPEAGLHWEDFEQIPFLTEHTGPEHSHGSQSWKFSVLPRRSGRAVIANVWGGHGGPDTPDGGNGGKTGEIFMSVSDVYFV